MYTAANIPNKIGITEGPLLKKVQLSIFVVICYIAIHYITME